MLEPFFENKVILSLADGCDKIPIVLHELGHAIGLEHEHIRPDRDMFIDVIYENIPEEFFSEFEKGSAHDVQTFNQTYDYHSVMHYPSDAFSIYWPLETLLPKQENLSLGNIKLSEGDISTANMLYSCPKCGGIFYGIFDSFGF
ncbi:GSCOCG00005312001-RA-CDS [Cotesia congregata]|nr:GSCOCG00005312001-RA-CDS [Cotesia congregata]